MKKIDEFKSRREWEEYAWKQIAADLFKSKSELEMEALLDTFFASDEKKRAIKRAATISLLKQGAKYRDIEKLLWVSPSTVSAIKKSLREKVGYVSNYERQNKKKKPPKSLTAKEWKKLKLKLRLETILTLPPPPPGVGIFQFGRNTFGIRPTHRKSGRRLPGPGRGI